MSDPAKEKTNPDPEKEKEKGGKAGRGPPDAIVQHLSQINASIAAIQAGIDKQEVLRQKDFDDHRRMREEDLRALSARMSHIGKQVSYLRENVCQSLTEQVRRAHSLLLPLEVNLLLITEGQPG